MKLSKGTAVLSVLLLIAACKDNQPSSNSPVGVDSPSTPVGAPAHKKHPLPIKGDHQNQMGTPIKAVDGDEIDWSISGSGRSYWVCFQDAKKVCTDQNPEFEVTTTGAKCTVDGSKLPAYYDVAIHKEQCGQDEQHEKGYGRGHKPLFNTHCNGCIIDQGP